MIRFYIDGTTGQKDGTEVTSINPITATGLFPSGSTEATKTVTVCIRADEGESYNQIMLGCNKPLLTGYYYFDNTFGICIDCITKLSVLEIRNENKLHIHEVEAALKKGNYQR